MVVGLQQHFSWWDFGLGGAVEEVMGTFLSLGKGLGVVTCGVVEGGPICFPTESSLLS